MTKIKRLVVPDSLTEEFKNFLDLAMANLSLSADDPELTKTERAVVKLVFNYLEGNKNG